MKILNKKKIITFSLSILFIVFFLFPLLLFGVSDIEEYKSSGLTLQIWKENSFNPFTFYYDLVGPGTTLPLGSGLFNFPSIFFIENQAYYYSFVIIFSFVIQTIGLKKLLKFLHIENFILLNFLYLFSISFFCNSYINEWGLHPYLQISFLPLILYYCLKYLKLEQSIVLFKLVFILGLLHLNGHPSTSINNLLFVVIFFLLNKKFFFLKEKLFYLAIFVFFLTISENIYSLFLEVEKNEGISRFSSEGYNIKHLFSGIYLFLTFFESFNLLDFPLIEKYESHDSRLPFIGIISYIAIYKSLELIYKKIK